MKLIAIRGSDAEARVDCLNDSNVSSGIFIDLPVSLEATRKWIESIRGVATRRDFTLEVDTEIVGFCGLANINHKNGVAELYIFLASHFQGKGLGGRSLRLLLSFAKHELGLRKINLYVSEGNDAAISLYRKAGFELEGTLKSQSWFRGQYVDRHIFSLFLNDHACDKDDLYSSLG